MISFKRNNSVESEHPTDFSYLKPDTFYFDSACQTLRPWQVVSAQKEYFTDFNACGGRVKYQWGQRVDEYTRRARKKLLDLVKKNEKDYATAFTLNTTYAINLLLMQLPSGKYTRVVTSEIEHNSVFLPSIAFAQKYQATRIVLPRDDDGNLLYERDDLVKAVVVLSATSNIDGRELKNIEQLVKDTHEQGGIVILDAAQSFAHSRALLQKGDWDAVCGSVHKMYGPSLGFMIVKKELLKTLEYFFIGGGTVTDVFKESYTLIRDEEELFAPLEMGLQNWSGIVGTDAAIDWLKTYNPEGKTAQIYEKELIEHTWQKLHEIERLTIINATPTAVISVYSDKIDAHRLAIFLGEQHIMCRSGYFCCHYYLQHLKQYPPLLRISLGLNNTKEQIDHLVAILKKILEHV